MSDTAAAPPATGPDRFLTGIVVGAILLIAVGVITVFAAGRAPRAAPPDPASPVGVVQSYVEALQAGDFDRAQTYLSRPAREAIASNPVRERFTGPGRPSDTERRVLFEPVRTEGDTTEVKVTISTFSANAEPFSARTFHREVSVTLVREDGAWRISQPAEPFTLLY
ncbi:MAG TPA: hypothetical protein VHL09_11245 [Dehalococcoidia bacterium]|nr:hypothetical protein [Dehalococcoidia bacterium]